MFHIFTQVFFSAKGIINATALLEFKKKLEENNPFHNITCLKPNYIEDIILEVLILQDFRKL